MNITFIKKKRLNMHVNIPINETFKYVDSNIDTFFCKIGTAYSSFYFYIIS